MSEDISQPSKARLVVLISGSGSNLQAILDACTVGVLPAVVVGVISDKSQAYGLERARRAGVAAICLPKDKEMERSEYDTRLAQTVAALQPDWIILAGWMRILSNSFLGQFPNRVINLHPALPDMFPGTHAIERAYQAYQRGDVQNTGVMVHLVPDEGVDSGPLLAQQVVEILPQDSLESLEQRMHAVEHVLLVKTLKEILYRK